MDTEDGLVRRLRKTRRERLVSHAALLLAAMPEFAAVEISPGYVRVSTRCGRSMALRFDLTVITTNGARIGGAVALHPDKVNAIDWPARVMPSTIRAGLPRTIVALSRRSIVEAFGEDVHPEIKAGLSGGVVSRASSVRGGRRAQVRPSPFRSSVRFDTREV